MLSNCLVCFIVCLFLLFSQSGLLLIVFFSSDLIATMADFTSIAAVEHVINDEYYSMEEILDKRITNGKVEYLIKWNEYSDHENTWESEENVLRDELITAYEIKVASQNIKKEISECTIKRTLRNSTIEKSKLSVAKEVEKKIKIKVEKEENDKDEDEHSEVNCWNDNFKDSSGLELKPEKIITVIHVNGELLFMIKWQGAEEANFVPARVANEKYTEMVIDFYQNKLKWRNN